MDNFIKKILFNKLLERGYIKKDNLKDYLLLIKNNERKRTTEELNKKFEEDKNRLK
jgi:hypothetical protein